MGRSMRSPRRRLVSGAVAVPSGRGGRVGLRLGLPVALLGVAAAGWWWSARMSVDMDGAGMGGMAMADGMSFGAFVLAWTAMMAAMMLPAVLPVVQLYARAAAAGRAAPLPCFVAGYLLVWSALAPPAYLAWRALEAPLAAGRSWAGLLAGGTLLVAGAYQLSPLKAACLRHCRSPMGFFLRFGGAVRRPSGALRMGVTHGLFCVGCCWALFAVLVAVGTMDLLWMAVLTAFVVLEKHGPAGVLAARAGAVACAGLGTALLLDPSLLTHLT